MINSDWHVGIFEDELSFFYNIGKDRIYSCPRVKLIAVYQGDLSEVPGFVAEAEQIVEELKGRLKKQC